MRSQLRATVVLAAASLLLLTACSGSTEEESAAPTSTLSSVFDFTARTVSGPDFAGADLVGQPVVMWFWAPWCTICRAESPAVATVAAEFDGRVTFVGVAGRGQQEDMVVFVEETGTDDFTQLADVDGSVWSRFGIVAQPSFVFVTPDGQTQVFAGSLGVEELRDAADQLLAG